VSKLGVSGCLATFPQHTTLLVAAAHSAAHAHDCFYRMVSPLHVLCATYTCSWCMPTLCHIPRSHTLADLALQVAEAILDKALPKRERGEGPPRSAPGETPLPTKFYHPSRGGGEPPPIV
jgi:hypothetical protein